MKQESDVIEETDPVKMCPFAPRAPFGDKDFDPAYGNEQAAMYPCIRHNCMAWSDDDCRMIPGRRSP